MQDIVLYLLAVVAKQEGVIVHAATVLSTHLHLAITDSSGRSPIFFQRLHRAIAMCTKAHRGWDEEVFNKSQTSRVELCSAKAFVSQIAYIIANCVEAGIVRRVRRYPGVVSRPSDIGARTRLLKRPPIAWLADKAIWPEEAELCFEMPQVLLEEFGLQGAQAAIADAVREAVRRARASRAREGLGFLGAKACVRAPIETRSTQPEQRGHLNPTVAAGVGERGALLMALERLAAWREAYGGCLERWRAGDRGVIWPAGTWRMVALHGAIAEERPQQLE